MASPPFPSAEAAWFWTMAVIEARADPARAPPPARPCRVEDVLRCLDGLYRRRRVELLHARVLRSYGRRGRAPDPRRPSERCDWRLWSEAIGRLDWPLRQAGLVGRESPTPRDPA